MTLFSCKQPADSIATVKVSQDTIRKVPLQKVPPQKEEIPEYIMNPVYALDKAMTDTIPTDTSQVLSFNTKGAIIIYPDTAWINQAQKEDMETYETVLSDHMFYQSEALDTLRSIGINDSPGSGIVYRRYYKFKLSSGRDLYVDMRKLRGAWGIILYNGKDVPHLCAVIGIEEVMDSLMNR